MTAVRAKARDGSPTIRFVPDGPLGIYPLRSGAFASRPAEVETSGWMLLAAIDLKLTRNIRMTASSPSAIDDRDKTLQPRIVGVLGGMGPLATVDFLRKMIDATPAVRDQEHVPVIVSSIPQVPDRTEAYFRGGPSPLEAMISSGRRLVAAGAELIVVPCNTAHLWFDGLQAALDVPLLNLVDEAVSEVTKVVRPGGRVGLLSTDATLASGLYNEAPLAEEPGRSRLGAAHRR